MSEPYQISITKAGDAIVCSIDMWQDVQEKIDRFFAERMEEEAVRQLREIGFERVVRCRDCKYAVVRHPLNPITGVPAGIEDWRCDYFWNADELCEVDPTGFCAWGERRDA